MGEWVYAASGGDGRQYPWGDEDDTTGRYRPKLEQGTSIPGAADVDAHSPQGHSPFGVGDLMGNVWQYTDVFSDEHTRAVLLLGSANYRPAGSNWYFPEARSLYMHEKYFIMDESHERGG